MAERSYLTGREREAVKILIANRASAVGNLMLGKFDDWQPFINEGCQPSLITLPRKSIRAGAKDVQKKISKEIDKFCKQNFFGMNAKKLSDLYEVILNNGGLEISLPDFENDYAKIKPQVLKDTPRHATVVISLWGLKFQFPEFELSNDIISSLNMARQANDDLNKLNKDRFSENKAKKEEISMLISNFKCGSRSCLLSCFNLIEAYLNGIGWEFLKNPSVIDQLSNKNRKRLEDTTGITFKEKLLKYPEIISGKTLWDSPDEDIEKLLEIKPFRDSLVHPSPFSAPEKFGGYDKLKNLYRVDLAKANESVYLICKIIRRISEHINIDNEGPKWFADLEELSSSNN
jgi:hypothetical protein